MNLEKSTQLPVKEKTEISAPQQKELKFIGSLRHCPGLTLFEINKKTLEIKPAEIVKEAQVDTNGQHVLKQKVQIKEGCFYVEALNLENAKKKYINLIKKMYK